MGKDTRICKACGATYEYCPKCQKYARLPQWMWRCDTEECNEIFETLSAYNMGVGSKDAIKIAIDKFGITNYSKFNDSIATKLRELFPIEKPRKFRKREMDIDLIAAEKITTPNEVVEPVIEGISEE